MRKWIWVAAVAIGMWGISACNDDSDRKRVGRDGSGGSGASGGASSGGMGGSTTSSGGSGGSSAGGSGGTAGSGGSGAMGGSGPMGGSGGMGGSAGAGHGGEGGDDSTEGEGGEAGGPAPSESQAVMFISDGLNDAVYRFTIAPDAQPTLTETIDVPAAIGLALGTSDELFVAEYSESGDIQRFTSPFVDPEPNGSIASVGASFPHDMTFVDDELWILNSAYNACTSDPQSIVRLAFESDGSAVVAGSVDGLIGANRGMLWHADTRQLFVSQCHSVNTVQRYRVEENHSVTPLPSIAVSSNPHGMVITPGGDLLVAAAGAPVGGTSLSRYSFEPDASATLTGTIEGNGLNTPIGLAFTPWGELYVVNQGDSSISRFTFDNSDQAHANGNVPLNFPTQAGVAGVSWILIAEHME